MTDKYDDSWFENWKRHEQMLNDLKEYYSKVRLCKKCLTFNILNENSLCDYCSKNAK